MKNHEWLLNPKSQFKSKKWIYVHFSLLYTYLLVKKMNCNFILLVLKSQKISSFILCISLVIKEVSTYIRNIESTDLQKWQKRSGKRKYVLHFTNLSLFLLFEIKDEAKSPNGRAEKSLLICHWDGLDWHVWKCYSS